MRDSLSLPVLSSVIALATLAGLPAQTSFATLGREHLTLQPVFSQDPATVNHWVFEDLDGDGDRDLITALEAYGCLVNRNDGGAFATTQVPAGFSRYVSVAAGDLDGDGDCDTVGLPGSVTGYVFPHPVQIWLNDGTGTFASAAAPTDQFAGHEVFLTDTDDDLDLDLVMVLDHWASSAPYVRVWENDGLAGFTDVTSQRLPELTGQPLGACSGDLTGDGRLDFVIVNGTSTTLLVNDGNGNFVDRSVWLPMSPIAIADMNVDGLPDLVGATAIAFNLGGGNNYRVVNTGVTLQGKVAVADFDGDTRPDIVAVHDWQPWLYLQTAPEAFVEATTAWFDARVLSYPAPGWPSIAYQSVAAVDIDDDGDPDIAIGGTEGRIGSFTVGIPPKMLINTGDRFVDGSAQAFEAGNRSTTAMAVGDIDGDGDVDAVVADSGRLFWPANFVFLNDGHGVFSEAPGRWVGSASAAIELADLDADGDLDLVTADGVSRYQYGGFFSAGMLGLNDGNGYFTDVSATHLPPVMTTSTHVAVGDVDGDGDRDLVFADYNGGSGATNRLYLNDGSAIFANASMRLPQESLDSLRVALGDVDGDGDADLVTVALQGMRLALNDGTGWFTDDTAARLQSSHITFGIDQGMQLVDVDGDGDLDIALPGDTLVNDGSGVFTSMSAPGQPCGRIGLEVVDVDEDGMPNRVESDVSVCVDGQTILSATWHDVFDSIGVADMDRDGDLDVIAASRAEPGGLFTADTTPTIKLVTNLRRQIHAPFLARVGQPYTLRTYASDGAATSSAVLLVGLPGPGIPLPGLGVFGIDPLTAIVFTPVLALDTGTPHETVVPIPGDPVFAGIELATQGVVWYGGSLQTAKLTNVVIDEILP